MMNLHFYGDFAKFVICAFLGMNTRIALDVLFCVLRGVLCVVVAWGTSFLQLLCRKLLFVE